MLSLFPICNLSNMFSSNWTDSNQKPLGKIFKNLFFWPFGEPTSRRYESRRWSRWFWRKLGFVRSLIPPKWRSSCRAGRPDRRREWCRAATSTGWSASPETTPNSRSQIWIKFGGIRIVEFCNYSGGRLMWSLWYRAKVITLTEW